jgi:AraC-like DNA-binding protein
VGIRLQPAASALVARDLEPLRDRIVDLASLDGEVSSALADAARRFAGGDPAPLWRLLERLTAAFPIDAKIEQAVVRLESSGGGARIESLARAAHWSLRTLQTRFLAAVGLSPKEFARILRLQATLRIGRRFPARGSGLRRGLRRPGARHARIETRHRADAGAAARGASARPRGEDGDRVRGGLRARPVLTIRRAYARRAIAARETSTMRPASHNPATSTPATRGPTARAAPRSRT